METNDIKTIEMTRKIREKNARQLAGKSQAEQSHIIGNNVPRTFNVKI